MASFLVLAVITIVLVVASRNLASGLGPSRFPPGTRAFEADLSIPLIGSYIAAREVELASGRCAHARAVLHVRLMLE